MPLQPYADFLGVQVTGDLAGITYVQRAGNRRTSYAKTYPTRRPSAGQLSRRNKFAEAVAFWKSLAPEDQETLHMIAAHHQMILHGHNLIVSCYLNQRNDWLVAWAQDIGRVWPYNNDFTHI